MTLREKIAPIVGAVAVDGGFTIWATNAIAEAVKEYMTSPEAVERAARSLSWGTGGEVLPDDAADLRAAILAALGGEP